MNRHEQFIITYMNIAKEIASLSYANRRKVGAIIVKNNMIISYGYNGTPYNFSNECEDDFGETKNIVVHAEANAILKAAKQGISLDDAAMYLTFSPCLECAKLILQVGINNVFYADTHSSKLGIELLEKGGVLVKQMMPDSSRLILGTGGLA